jgi:hypothetical protein
MSTKENFNEMVAFDFSNLHLQQGGNDNCYSDPCDCNSDPCDCNCVCDNDWIP